MITWSALKIVLQRLGCDPNDHYQSPMWKLLAIKEGEQYPPVWDQNLKDHVYYVPKEVANRINLLLSPYWKTVLKMLEIRNGEDHAQNGKDR